MNFSKFTIVVFSLIIISILTIGLFFGGLLTRIDADKVAVIEFPNGNVNLWTSPGWHIKWFGKITNYEKSNQYWFSNQQDQGKKSDQSIQTRFNDSGTAKVSGGVRYDLPYGDKNLMLNLHMRYGSPENVEHQLIRPAVEKSILLSGPLRSSKEVFSTGQGRFLQDIEDQLIHGAYKTYTRSIEKIDEITKEKKIIQIEEVIRDENSFGGIARVDESAMSGFGIKVYNFVINDIVPDAQILAQIQEQQKITMDVQTSIARAKQAEQAALTAQKEGEAIAAKSKWEQEAIKAKEVTKANQEKEVAVTKALKEKEVAVTKANQEKEVAILSSQAAEFYNKEIKLKADADSTYRRKMMESDGALEQKLKTYIEVNTMYAKAIENHKGPWVPNIIMGQNSQNSNPASDMINLLMSKTARDLSLTIEQK